MASGDWNLGNVIYNTNGITMTPNLYYGNSTVPTIYSGFVTVTDQTSPKPYVEGGLKPESDLEWLRRRIREVCWVPA